MQHKWLFLQNYETNQLSWKLLPKKGGFYLVLVCEWLFVQFSLFFHLLFYLFSRISRLFWVFSPGFSPILDKLIETLSIKTFLPFISPFICYFKPQVYLNQSSGYFSHTTGRNTGQKNKILTISGAPFCQQQLRSLFSVADAAVAFDSITVIIMEGTASDNVV